MSSKNGFTLIELILVIVVLGALAIAAIPSFTSISESAAVSSRDGVAGAVRDGISLFRANDLATNGAPGIYPTTLGGSNGQCSNTNPCFGTVLTTAIMDTKWTKLSDTQYSFNDGTNTVTYTYDSAAGTFISPTAP